MIGSGLLRARNVPRPSFRRLGALVSQREEFCGGLDFVRAQLLEHPLITDTLPERDNDGVGSYPQDGVADLAEALYEAPQRLPLLLLDGVEVALLVGARESALKISHELVAKIIPGADRP